MSPQEALTLLLSWHDEVRRQVPMVPSPFGIEAARAAVSDGAVAESEEAVRTLVKHGLSEKYRGMLEGWVEILRERDATDSR